MSIDKDYNTMIKNSRMIRIEEIEHNVRMLRNHENLLKDYLERLGKYGFTERELNDIIHICNLDKLSNGEKPTETERKLRLSQFLYGKLKNR